MLDIIIALSPLAGPTAPAMRVRVEPRLRDMNPGAVDEIAEKVEDSALGDGHIRGACR